MTELAQVLEPNETKTTWADRTYRSERGLRHFLATLTPAQLAEAEVLVDDDCYVVFYPIIASGRKAGAEGGFHFDLETVPSDPASSQPYQVNQVSQAYQADQVMRGQAVSAAAPSPESNPANPGLKVGMIEMTNGATSPQLEQQAELPGLLTSVRI